MSTAWDHLPNAKHIDRVLASVTANLELWDTAWDAARDAAWDATRDAAWGAARKAVSGAARGEVWSAARGEVWGEAWDAAWDAPARDAASDAVLALVAYDDCAHMLDSDVGELKILAAFGDTRAILLLPACIAFAKEKELA